MVNIYVYFNGNCREAVSYYADIFGVQVGNITTYEELGFENLTEEGKKRIGHTEIYYTKEKYIMFADTQESDPIVVGRGFDLTINDTYEKCQEMFNKFKEKGEVVMDFTPTQWTSGYGIIKDLFGIKWQFSAE